MSILGKTQRIGLVILWLLGIIPAVMLCFASPWFLLFALIYLPLWTVFMFLTLRKVE